MGFILDDDNIDVTVPNKRVKSNGLFGGGVVKDIDVKYPDVNFGTPKMAKDLQLGLPSRKRGVISKGAKIIRDSQDRRRSKNKSFGIKSSVIKDGVRVIRKTSKRR